MMQIQSRELYYPSPLDRAAFLALLGHLSKEGAGRVMEAYDFAKEAHRGQWRRDGIRYFEHPKAVAAILLQLGVSDADVIIAALLHDVVEDCGVTEGEIKHRFGAGVARYVQLVSKKPGICEEQYFVTLATSAKPQAWLVKLADRLHNLSTLTDDPVRQAWCNTKKVEQVEETRAKVMPLVSSFHAYLGYRSLSEWFNTQLTQWCAQRWAEVHPIA